MYINDSQNLGVKHYGDPPDPLFHHHKTKRKKQTKLQTFQLSRFQGYSHGLTVKC